MTSPLLIVFVGRGGNHWVLVNLPFILGCGLTQFNGSGKMWGHLQATWGNKNFHSSLSTDTWSISVPLHLLGRFYLTLISARLGMSFVPFWDAYHRMVWWYLRLFNSGWKTSVMHDLVKMYLISIPPPGIIKLHEIQVCPQFNLARMLAEEFRGPLHGLTCVINVFTQLQPPCCSTIINYR